MTRNDTRMKFALATLVSLLPKRERITIFNRGIKELCFLALLLTPFVTVAAQKTTVTKRDHGRA